MSERGPHRNEEACRCLINAAAHVVSLVLLLGVRKKDLSEGFIVSQLEPQKFTLIKYLSPVSAFIMKVLVFNYYYLFYIYRTNIKSRSFRFKRMFTF